MSNNLDEVESLARMFIKSGLYPDVHNVDEAKIKILAGQELGIGPVAAMRDVLIINGKVTLAAAQISALIKRSLCYDFKIIEWNEKEAVLRFFNHNIAFEPDISFTYEDAERMGLTSSSFYQAQPKTMLFWRALTMGARMFCADLFGGSIYTPDELRREAAAAPTIADPWEHILTGESKFKGCRVAEIDIEVLRKAVKIPDPIKMPSEDRLAIALAIKDHDEATNITKESK